MISHNKDVRERYKNAAKSYVKKIKLEKKVNSKLKKHFNGVADDIFDVYGRSGELSVPVTHRIEMQKIIKEHYGVTADQFDDTVRDVVGDPDNNPAVNSSLTSIIKKRARNRSMFSATKIHQTTVRQAKRNLNEIIDDADDKTDYKSIAKKAKRLFKEQSIGRLLAIASTETQNAAEKTKSDEVQAMTKLKSTYTPDTTSEGEKPKPVLFSSNVKKKMWTAVLDDHTREDHVEADGQEVLKNQLYDVGGESLMEPGDDQHGATPGNLVNCRCSSEIIVE